MTKSSLAGEGDTHQLAAKKWVRYLINGAVLMVVLFLVFLAAALGASSSLFKSRFYTPKFVLPSDSGVFNSSSHNFFEYLHLGDFPFDADSLPAPPTGAGIFKGKISYHNKPAKGVILSVVLDSKYNATGLVTDADGVFTLNLPPGSHFLNYLQTERWEEKPETGSFTLYYGGEEKLVGAKYDRYGFIDRPSYSVDITTDPKEIHLAVTINDDITLTWPPTGDDQVKASIEDTIHWEQYPGAVKYFVEIQHVEREGSSSTFHPILSKVLSGETTILLSSLKHIKVPGKEAMEYAVSIIAFDEEGSPIAESPESYRGGTFLLSDGNRLVEEGMDTLFDLTSIEDADDLEDKLEAISLNERRAEAVEVLIEENMLEEAEILLSRIEDGYAPGTKEALMGYMLTLQGECAKANEMFDKALTLNPAVCIPDSYRSGCD